MNLIHETPGRAWTVAELSAAANMSRASFAERFRQVVVGQTPRDYLVSWRISLAHEVGYESPSARARAFRRKTGVSSRKWIQGDKH